MLVSWVTVGNITARNRLGRDKMILANKVERPLLLAMLIALLFTTFALAQTGTPLAAKLGTPQVDRASEAGEPDPGSLFNYAGQVGQVLRFGVVGSDRGAIWGDGTYTSDSLLAVAAVHAGMLEVGQMGVVTVEIVPGQESYAGAVRNGIASMAYGPWDLGYRILGAEPGTTAQVQVAPADLSIYRGQNGTVLQFQVTGTKDGEVWGNGFYTDDSSIGMAAVHAGLLEAGQTGTVALQIMPGQERYAGSTTNGVTTLDYGPWSGSFRFLSQVDVKVRSKLTN